MYFGVDRSVQSRPRRTTWRASTKCSKQFIQCFHRRLRFSTFARTHPSSAQSSSSWSAGAASWFAIAFRLNLRLFPITLPRVSRGFVDCLVQLHSVDIAQHGLVSLGKPDGFLERQVRGWFERWKGAKTEEIALMDRLIQWLTDRLPVSRAPTLVHNDFKLDNVMLNSSDPGRS